MTKFVPIVTLIATIALTTTLAASVLVHDDEYSPAGLSSLNDPSFQKPSLEVEVKLFSSLPDPLVRLSANRPAVQEALEMIANIDSIPSFEQARANELGYSGLIVNGIELPSGVLPEVEGKLLAVIASTMDLAHVMNENTDVSQQFPNEMAVGLSRSVRAVMTQSELSVDNEDVYDVGPDNVTYYADDIHRWRPSKVEYNNNCYNYASSIVTMTFAQPGRGSGHIWDYNECEDMAAAAARDGTKVFRERPDFEEGDPELGHYTALVMWPDVNFHWYRLDKEGTWSHKPGGTPARNTDLSGNTIYDPAAEGVDRGPYTEFCFYTLAVPSELNIN